MHNEGDRARAMSAYWLVFHFQRLVHYSACKFPSRCRFPSTHDCRVSCSCRCNCQAKLVLPCLPPEEGKDLVERDDDEGGGGSEGEEIVLQVVGRRSPCCLNRLNSEHMCACNFTRRRCEAFRIRICTRIHIRIRIPHTQREGGGGVALWLCSECQRLHITATLIRSARHLSR